MRRRDRGTAILITMLLVVAVLGGGAVLVGLQLSSTRSSATMRETGVSLHCAEAGVSAARATVAANYASWNGALCNGCVVGDPSSEPAWLQHPIVDHDLDGDGTLDFVITLKDNDDETVTADDLATDNDLQVWVIATCTKVADNRKQVQELVRFNIGRTCYNAQLGGCGGNNNEN